MFSKLTDSLTKILGKFRSTAILTEELIDQYMREIRLALLESDVAINVVKELTSNIKPRALGTEVIKSVTPGQMLTKIVYEELVKILGSDDNDLIIKKSPTVIMMVGLQGSGKTSTTAKLGADLKKQNKKVLLASLDVYRPAAQEQLKIIAQENGLDSLEIIGKQQPLEITERALKHTQENDYNILILDTAGRKQSDTELMEELSKIYNIANPSEVLLVADSMLGQGAANMALEFKKYIDITGIIVTKLDSDAKGGAILSMKYVTNVPIKFLTTGEKVDHLEKFYPDRIASRIFGSGDVISLVEKAATLVEEEEAEKLSRRIQQGSFNLEDFRKQLVGLKKMGGITSIMKFLPSTLNISAGSGNAGDEMISRQEAIILSMTKAERKNPDIINGSRRRRIAAGSGAHVSEVNRLLKQFYNISTIFKKMKNESYSKRILSKLSNFLG